MPLEKSSDMKKVDVANPFRLVGDAWIAIAKKFDKIVPKPMPMNTAESKNVKSLLAVLNKKKPIANINSNGKFTRLAPNRSNQTPVKGLVTMSATAKTTKK